MLRTGKALWCPMKFVIETNKSTWCLYNQWTKSGCYCFKYCTLFDLCLFIPTSLKFGMKLECYWSWSTGQNKIILLHVAQSLMKNREGLTVIKTCLVIIWKINSVRGNFVFVNHIYHIFISSRITGPTSIKQRIFRQGFIWERQIENTFTTFKKPSFPGTCFVKRRTTRRNARLVVPLQLRQANYENVFHKEG